ncbi:MAG: hypothetical protein OXG56_11940 [Gammaproteobacteria bacterium]|nr:hypothetical protein [Gammaproteobacteria bacterium]
MTTQAPLFNTHKSTKRLTDSGVDAKQAEAHAEAIDEALTGGVATSADIAVLRPELKLWLGSVVIAVGFALAGLIAFATNLILSAISG